MEHKNTFPPDPKKLFEEAKNERKKNLMENYWDTIRVLKDQKKFSFREIAEWFNERGIDCDHNTIYRHYSALQAENPSAYNDWQDKLELAEQDEFRDRYGV